MLDFLRRSLAILYTTNMEDLVDNPPLLKCELVVAWYEFILNREKLFLHLKKLRDDINSKKLLCVLARNILSVLARNILSVW